MVAWLCYVVEVHLAGGVVSVVDLAPLTRT